MKSALEKLTDMQQLFVIEYAADMNRQRAVREAGYTGSDATLTVRAAQLLANSKIKAALAEVGTLLDKRQLTVELLAEQLYKFVTFDPGQLEDEDGYLVCSLKQLPPDVRQCIASWEIEEKAYTTEDGTEIRERKTKVKWVDKLKATELGMRWRKMLAGDTQLNITNDNRTFNWQEFYADPPNVVEQRMIGAMDNAEATQRHAAKDSTP